MMETIPLGFSVNGVRVERPAVRADQLLIDFLHEALHLTGTKFSCGVGACGACKIAASTEPAGPLMPVLACYARMKAVNGLHITTVEGLQSGEALHPLQLAFLENYAFQC